MKAPKTCNFIMKMEGKRKAIEKLDNDSIQCYMMITALLDLQGYIMVKVNDLPTIHIFVTSPNLLASYLKVSA